MARASSEGQLTARTVEKLVAAAANFGMWEAVLRQADRAPWRRQNLGNSEFCSPKFDRNALSECFSTQPALFAGNAHGPELPFDLQSQFCVCSPLN